MRVFFMFIIVVLSFLKINSQTTIAQWTFETSIPTTAGPHSAETGSGFASGFHTSSSTVYSNPAGNGSAESFSSNFWAIGDYYEFEFSTTGLQNISISWDATGSSTGPRDFRVQYSTDGTNFSDASSGANSVYALTGESWSSGTNNPNSTRTLNLSDESISVNNSTNVYVRFTVTSSTSINGATIATTGTSRVDNIIVTGNVPMPVEFSKFTTQVSGKTSFLTFSTASETNNDYFTIERSADGRNFDAIGEIKGAGNSNTLLNYDFIDESPLPGINYYRIKQTDFDGKFSYSDIRSIRHKVGNASVTPRNTDGRLNITTDMEQYDVIIINSAGQEVLRYSTMSGDQNIHIDVLQAGLYFVNVTNGGESQITKIVKF